MVGFQHDIHEMPEQSSVSGYMSAALYILNIRHSSSLIAHEAVPESLARANGSSHSTSRLHNEQ